MDPVTVAIAAAVTAGVTSGVTKVGEQAIVDSYNALKKRLEDRFGKKSEVVKAVKGVENKPESEARRNMLHEELVEAKADSDLEILMLAKTLLDLVDASPKGSQFIQQARGDNIAQAGEGGKASVVIHLHKE